MISTDENPKCPCEEGLPVRGPLRHCRTARALARARPGMTFRKFGGGVLVIDWVCVLHGVISWLDPGLVRSKGATGYAAPH